MIGVMSLGLVAFAGPAAIGQTAESLPPRKPGYWEIRMLTDSPGGGGNTEIASQMCIDAATDRDMMDFGLQASKEACKKYETKRDGAALVIDAECTFGPMTSTTRSTITGDFQSTYTIRIEGTTDGGFNAPGAPKGPQKTVVVQTARWLGPACGNGMKPGDIAIPGGMKFNVKQLKGLQKMLPQTSK
jgi:hypothetical protein